MSISSVTGTTVDFEMGRVLGRTFGAIGRNAALFFGLAAALAGIPDLIAGVWQADARAANPANAAAVVSIVVGTFLDMLGATILQVSITRATVGDLVGERPGFFTCFKNGIAVLLPMIGLTIVVGLGVALAMLLLIVPGIMLAVAWSVAVPAYVQERIGVMDSLTRSRALTKGARWKIFALFLVWWTVAFAVQLPTTMLTAATQAPPYIGAVLQAVVATLLNVVLSAVTAAIYAELRDVKEGVSPKELETIFA